MENMPSGSAQPLPDHLHAPTLHAGFWRRVAAYLVDWLILMPVFFVLEFAFIMPIMLQAARGNPRPQPDFALLPMVWVFLIVLPWLYYALCESSKWQATPGKLAVGLRVTDLYGRRIGFGRATGRFFGKIISGLIFNIGYMMAGWTQRKQCLHDLMAEACVVRKEGLAAFERDELAGATAAPAAASSMPGWAVALIVVGACFFMIIPIIAILAAIAIPAYQNYLVRAQVAEGVVLARGAETAVVEYVSRAGAVPIDNAAAGLANPDAINGRYVSSVKVENGSVVVTFGGGANPAIAGQHLEFRPYGSRDNVQWRCGSPDIQVKYLPVACRGRAGDASMD